MAATRPLDREDFASATWRRLEQHLQERLDDLRILNDATATETATAMNRGRISELKKILDLAKAASSKQGAIPNTILDQMPG